MDLGICVCGRKRQTQKDMRADNEEKVVSGWYGSDNMPVGHSPHRGQGKRKDRREIQQKEKGRRAIPESGRSRRRFPPGKKPLITGFPRISREWT